MARVQKKSMSAAIETAERPSKKAATSALDEAAPINWTKIATAPAEPAISGRGCIDACKAFGEISPNDSATAIMTNTTMKTDLSPAREVASRKQANTVERARPIMIIWPADTPQPPRRLLTYVPAMTESELIPKMIPY